MPEWDYRPWRDEDNLALVKQICPSNINEYMQFPSGVIRSDVARYLYMYRHGGIYFDTDFLFLLPINEDLLSRVCILGIEDENMPELGGGPKLGMLSSVPNLVCPCGLNLWTVFLLASEKARSPMLGN